MARVWSVVAAVLLAAVGVAWPGGGPAEAYCISSIDAKCNPQALGVFAAFGETAPGVVSSTATATTGTVALNTAANAAAAVAVTATGLGVGHMLWGGEAPPELVVPLGREPGWVEGDNISEYTTTAYGTRTRWMEYRIVSAPAYGANGALVYQRRCVFEAGGGSGTMASPNIGQLGNPASAGSLGTVQCPSDGDGGYVYPGPWTQHTVSITTGFRRVSGVGVEWRPTGYPGEIDPGVEGGFGLVTTTLECGNGVDATHLVTASALVTFEPSAEFEYPGAECPAGEVVFGYGITWTTSEGGEQDIVPWTPTPEWVHSIPVEWPGCIGGGCEVTLWRGQGAEADYCGVAGIGCPSWYADAHNEDKYECRFGGYVVDLGYCNIFRKPGQVQPNTGTQTDPKNGVQASNGAGPDTSLDLAPGELPGGGTVPGGGPVGPGWDPQGGEEIPTGECFPGGWGIFNPVEWVLRPVKCALVWAFVPRAQVVETQFEGLNDAMSEHGVLSVMPAVAEVPAAISDGWTAGCSGGLVGVDVPIGDGSIPFGFPCTPGEAVASVDSDYDEWYLLWTVLLVASTVWTGFILVRAQVGTRDA